MTATHDDDATPSPATTATPAAPATSPPPTDDIRAKRVAVARDVRERIALGKLTIAKGGYLYVNDVDSHGRGREIAFHGGDLQPHVDFLESRCTVCALGAVLLSKARLFDAVPADVVATYQDQQSAFHGALSDVFDEETLYRVESAFEMGVFAAESPTDELRGAVAFGREFRDSDERCDAVMARIIDGNGEFLVDPMNDRDYVKMMGWEDDDDDEDSTLPAEHRRLTRRDEVVARSNAARRLAGGFGLIPSPGS